MNKFKVVILVALWINASFLLAQKWREDINLDQIIENLVQLDENSSYENIYESMYQYQQNPINLNSTNEEQLSSIYVLTEEQIKNLILHEQKFGKLLSIYELQAIPGFDLETIYTLLAFSDVRESSQNISNQPFLIRVVTEDNNSLIYRIESTLERQRGYLPVEIDSLTGKISNGYIGGPIKHLLRYRVSHRNDFAIGLTATKGSGERFIWDPESKRYGYDFYSMHFVKYNVGRVKALALGDYQLQFGQGLIMSGGFAIGKGSETTNSLRRSNTGIRPYTSTVESGFLRGAAATIELNKRFDLSIFASRNKLDGALINDTTIIVDSVDLNNININDIYTSNSVYDGFDEDKFNLTNNQSNGQHRTLTEILKKRRITQTVGGANLSYVSKDKKFKTGATYVHTSYSQEFNKSDRTYNNMEFSGKKNATYGLNYSYNIQNFNFFGELAQSSKGGVGVLTGVVAYLSKKVEFAMLYRKFDPTFHSFYANAFGENTRNINETGIYWGTKIRFNNKLMLAAYYDKFTAPWLKSTTDAPSFGNEYLMQLNYSFSRKIKMYVRTKVETKGKNQSDNITPIDFVMPATKAQYILNLDYNASKIVSMKSRVQWSSYHQSNAVTKGYAIMQDFNFDIKKWTISTRYALFDTDDFDNRQYSYEKDVLYAFSIPAYSGKGIRTYILLRYNVSKKLDFWLKVGRYLYAFDAKDPYVGSGLNQIEGNRSTTLRLQMRVKL